MDEEQLVLEFVDEAREHLADIEAQLLQIEALGADIDDCLVNTVFRAIHSIKGAAGFLGLQTINRLSHSLENVLGKFREHKIIPTPYNVDTLLKGADRLRSLIENVDESNNQNVKELVTAIDSVLNEEAKPAPAAVQTKTEEKSASETETVTPPKKTRARKSTAGTKATGRSRRKDAGESTSNDITPEADSNPSGPQVADQAIATVQSTSESVASEINADDHDSESNAESPESSTGFETPNSPSSEPATDSAPVDGKQAGRPAARRTTPEASIRVGVRVLDRLMNLAGELVLSRNQLLRTIGNSRTRTAALDSIAAGLDQVTTELQETIMQTRMQPIGNVFGKFPRVIRDLSSQLGKQVRLDMEGNEVEVDKTIVEAIADPLTHLIRNSADHGIERPDVRRAAGKAEEGTVRLRASHQAGKVVIEIIDDGAGMDPAVLRQKAVDKGLITAEQAETMSNRESLSLIFAPGFSTAAAITDVSGRGVGMDVVRTNIEKLGGAVEIDSVHRKGTTIRITLPLTLAIVPSMIVSSAGHRYALPQANIVELVRADGQEKRIEWVSGAEVLRLRGNLIPLVRLRSILELSSLAEEDLAEKIEADQVVVIESGATRFALAVDQVLDSEEIVVKPLGRHLTNLSLLAGATILGDGRVAMILDAAGVAAQASLSSESDEQEDSANVDTTAEANSDYHRLVLLSVSERDRFAVSMDVVSRIERVTEQQIDSVGGRKVLQYRGGTLPLIEIGEALNIGPQETNGRLFIIVFQVFGREVGLVAPHLEDIRHCRVDIDGDACNERGVAGVTVVDNRTTRLLDLYGLCEILRPEWFEEFKKRRPLDDKNRVLVCEDSGFFRTFLVRTLREEGYEVFDAEDGEFGWEVLNNEPNFDLVVTDVEMPRLDGFGLTERIRGDNRFRHLPVIALTSLADDASVARGHAAGVNEYQVKMNKPALLASISKLLGTRVVQH